MDVPTIDYGRCGEFMNLYWSVYKNLEKELVKLTSVIHFDDAQENVYSVHIADLLIRTAIEIE